jgi:hypothetical protein
MANIYCAAMQQLKGGVQVGGRASERRAGPETVRRIRGGRRGRSEGRVFSRGAALIEGGFVFWRQCDAGEIVVIMGCVPFLRQRPLITRRVALVVRAHHADGVFIEAGHAGDAEHRRTATQAPA